jgi:hypothetical protein
MAFNKQITARGEPFNAYWRVEETRIVNKNTMMVCVRGYRNASDNYHLDERCFDNVPYAMSTQNAWEQAYAYLKNLPEFAGAIDC